MSTNLTPDGRPTQAWADAQAAEDAKGLARITDHRTPLSNRGTSATFPVTIEGAEYPNPSTAQRLIAKLDQDHYPAGGYESRTRVINREIVPLATALEGIDLSNGNIAFLAWLIKSDADAEMIELITKIRSTP